MRSRLAITALLGLLATACGDIERIRVEIAFPDEDARAATESLLFIVDAPEPSAEGGCGALWTVDPVNFPNRSSIDYPNVNDIVAAPITLAPYAELTFIVYAYASKEVDGMSPLAGGCRAVETASAEGQDILVRLERAP